MERKKIKSYRKIRKSIFLDEEDQSMLDAIKKKHSIKKDTDAIKEVIRNYYDFINKE